MTPDNLRYSREHEWVRVEGGEAVVGITDHAQKALGDLVYVELPAIGKAVQQGKELANVESVKAASEVFAPLSGEVAAVNRSLTDKPELINKDPYGEGWICRVKIAAPAELASLLTAAAYDALVKESEKE